MHAAVVHTLGQPPRYSTHDDPVAGDGEVLVHVHAAALTNLAKLASSDPDYSEGRQPPFVAGVEGVGTLDDGRRIAFGARRPPFGSMAELSVSPSLLMFDVPDGVDDVTAAALLNPALSSWLPLASHVDLKPGETVVVLGATSVAGQLAVQIARHLGAGRVVAAGRNPDALKCLPDLGADAVVALTGAEDDDLAALADGVGDGCDIVLDYLWGEPAEVLLDALPRSLAADRDVRYLQIGNSAGRVAAIDGNALRRSGTSILGSGSLPGLDIVKDIWRQLMEATLAGGMVIEVDPVPLAEVESQWAQTTPGKRVVFTI